MSKNLTKNESNASKIENHASNNKSRSKVNRKLFERWESPVFSNWEWPAVIVDGSPEKKKQETFIQRWKSPVFSLWEWPAVIVDRSPEKKKHKNFYT